MNDIKLSLRQIEKMEHAIGFSREKIKRNRYEAYRNRFVVNNSDKDWEELVSIGYAEKREFEIEKQIGYYVSELGMKYLGVLFVVKQIPAHITEDIIPKMQSLPQSAKDIIMSRENKVIDYTSQMLIINPDGRADSWVPSVSDVFAEDWEIVI